MNDTLGTLWMPPGGSTVAGDVDSLFYFILYVSIAFFAVVVIASAYFVIKYRRRGEATVTSGISHNTALEVTWTVIPTLLLVVVFIWGFKGYLELSVAPGDAIEIKTTGQKWFWSFDYPNGAVTTNSLTIPVNQPVKLLLSSKDVIHSFYVPNFRTKMDVLPNRYTLTWFEPTQIGEFDLFCTEFCGKGHSEMIGKVHVVSQADYEKFLEESAGPREGESLRDYGARLYVERACVTCHSIDGSKNTCPTFKGKFGNTEHFTDGTSGVVDENYVRESILNPNAKIVKGYDPVMPTFQGILKDRDVDALVEFIKSLK